MTEGVRSSGYSATVLRVSRYIFVGACCLDVCHEKSGEFNSYFFLPPELILICASLNISVSLLNLNDTVNHGFPTHSGSSLNGVVISTHLSRVFVCALLIYQAASVDATALGAFSRFVLRFGHPLACLQTCLHPWCQTRDRGKRRERKK